MRMDMKQKILGTKMSHLSETFIWRWVYTNQFFKEVSSVMTINGKHMCSYMIDIYKPLKYKGHKALF